MRSSLLFPQIQAGVGSWEVRARRGRIVTQAVPLETFYEAEAYHQDYAARHPMQPYILFTAAPKVSKLRKNFADR
jgi:peptide methionine sulfoxide reductase MsrA